MSAARIEMHAGRLDREGFTNVTVRLGGEVVHNDDLMLAKGYGRTSFARDVANRVCFLEEGRIIEEGRPADVFTAPRDERTQRFLRRIVEAGRMPLRPDQMPGWPLTPQSFRLIASCAAPASPTNAAPTMAQVQAGQRFFLMLVVESCDPAWPEPRRALSAPGACLPRATRSDQRRPPPR